jgi:hypothetical protein
VSNLTLACVGCNQAKGSTPVEEFLAGWPDALAKVLAQAKKPLRDAAAVSSTRRALWEALLGTGRPVHVATGGRAKWNRSRTGAPKTHTLDALHVGVLDTVTGWPGWVLVASATDERRLGAAPTSSATGRGGYARTRTNRYGFPRLRLPRTRRVHGFGTGDLVRAVVPAGLKRGTHTGRVAVRTTGSFNIRTASALIQGINYRHVRLLQRADGWAYTTQDEPTMPTPTVQVAPGFLPALKDRVSALDFR